MTPSNGPQATSRATHCEFRPLEPTAIRGALPLVLAETPDRRASRSQVAGLIESASQPGVELAGLAATRGGKQTAVAIAMHLPGRSALLLSPPPGTSGMTEADVESALARLAEQCRTRGALYAQALGAPGDEAFAARCERTGFRHITSLLYLDRDARYPWTDPPPAGEVSWTPYGPDTHQAFLDTLAETYRDSADCPELTPLRTTADALASHRAGGLFRPNLWELARIDGRVAGCVLLTAIAHGRMLDLVYMGVASGRRRRGVGSLLLRRALEQCRRSGAARLTLAVDVRNDAARRLYDRFGFQLRARREVFLRGFQPAPPPARA